VSNSEVLEPKPAATILMMAKDGSVLVGERSHTVRFMGGFVAFPGGRVDPGDGELSSQLFGRDDEVCRPKAAALRELYEETGVLFDGERARLAMPEQRGESAELAYRALGIHLDPARLVPGGRWVTPESGIMRFDTRFFLVRVEEAIAVEPRTSEFSWTRFVRPDEILEHHRRLEVMLAPPTKFPLEVLALGFDDAPRRLLAIPEANGGESPELESLSGIRTVPVRTPTLPPARHTNAYIIGDEKLIIVDPATYEESEREKLLERIAVRTRAGAIVDSIVLTHHHLDHVGAAAYLARELEAPIVAHPITRDLLRGGIVVDRTIDEGDRIDLGEARSGGRFAFEVMFTPGHAPGHIVLVDRRPNGRAMIVGDMVAGIGTIIIDPPEGDMAQYITQLERLRARTPMVLFPAHGPPAVDGKKKLDEYIGHRLMREAKVSAALEKKGSAEPFELLDDAYDDTPPAMLPFAARSCLAHLEKLVHDGRATRSGDRFSVR
jgi:glyoxylase-like metal-dependent hydrolase (beta-lactamase superfamily II)/8-oxo-dGTP pyrophosphatase MutT (NUDIX family)